MNKLTITNYRDNIIDFVDQSQVTIIVGEPGSGKSTKVPQYIYSHMKEKIIVTQPRRIAAVRMAERIQKEVGSSIDVAYTVRFESTATENTRIHLVTDGILLKLLYDDRLFSTYKIIVIDEVHERTIFIDLILFLLKRKLKDYPTHKLILTSATMDTEKIKTYFAPYMPKLLDIPKAGNFKLDIVFIKGNPGSGGSINLAIEKAKDIHLHEPEGDILVFLSGSEDCLYAKRRLEMLLTDSIKDDISVPSLQIHCLFGSQAVQEQAITFRDVDDPLNTRKIIFATNIAETSLTIPNIVYVIDTGLVKQTSFNKQNHSIQLKTILISKSQAIQRAGRAGRTRDGKCFRMYTRETYNEVMANDITPEVKRSELRSFLVMLMKLGIQEYCDEDFIDPPDYSAVETGLIQLFSANLIEVDKKTKITKTKADNNLMNEQETVLKLPVMDYEIVKKVVKSQTITNIKNDMSDHITPAHTIYFKLTKIGKLCSRFPIDPLLAKSLLLSKILHIHDEFIYFASFSSTTENLISQDSDTKKRFYELYIKEKDLRGDYYCYIDLIKKYPGLFYEKALKNLKKIATQLNEIVQIIGTDKIKDSLKYDYAYLFYQKHRSIQNFSNGSLFSLCLVSGFSFYAAVLDLNSPGSYILIFSLVKSLLDSESIYEMIEDYPKSIICVSMRGETQYGTPVLSTVFNLEFPDLAKAYVSDIKSMISFRDQYFKVPVPDTEKGMNQPNTSKQDKIAEAKEKFFKRIKKK